MNGSADPWNTPRGELLLHVAATIMRRGFAVVAIGGGRCAVPGCDCGPSDEQWAYTIGLAEQGLPELVITGLADAHALERIEFVIDQMLTDCGLLGGATRWLGPTRLTLTEVPDAWLTADPTRMAVWFEHYAIGRSHVELPQVMQVVWGDADHVASGAAELSAGDAFQPLLADNPYDFPRRRDRASRRQLRRSRPRRRYGPHPSQG